MITVVATAFKEKNSLPMFIGSLLCQTNNNWKAIIFHNGIDAEMENIFDTITDLYPDLDINNKFEFFFCEENNGFWGAKNRDFVLKNLVDTKYILNSSVQDYFVPIAIEEILKAGDADLIYFNSINHLFGYERPLDSKLETGWIDWGNFAVKTEIAKQVGINKPEDFCADGHFVQDLLKSGSINIKYKINKILTIHN